jgi:hypothetical protein
VLADIEDVLQIIGYVLLGFDDECKLGALLEEPADGQASLGANRAEFRKLLTHRGPRC